MVFYAGLGALTALGPLLSPAGAQTPPPQPAATPAPVAASPGSERMTQAQLEQLLAPIALYPDDLLMQMLMASTYPLEVVQAKRWLGQGQNGALRGDALAQALVAQSWDPSVKSLVPFPDVLTLMNDQLEWTQQVGDAVLAQQQDVMNSIQVLRGRAQANGALQSGPQQTVNVTQNVAPAQAPGASAPVVAPPPQVITIAPTQPDTVYVPAYDPNQVYGTWPYPQSPPYSYPPPVGWGLGSALLTGMAFAGGAAIVGSLWGWGNANWGGGDINVNANRYNNINANRGQISGNTWRHDTTHRQGVAYRNEQVRNSVGANRAGADRAQSREQFRGRVDQAQRGEGIGGRGGPGGAGGVGGAGGLGGPGGPGRPGGVGGAGALGGAGGPGRPGGVGGPGGIGGPGDRGGIGDRGGVGDRSGPGAQRPGGGQALADRGGAAQRPAAQHTAAGRPQARQAPARQSPQGFQGMGDGGRERAAANRGATSRQGQPAARTQAQQRASARPAGGGGARAGARSGGGGGARAGGGGGRGGGGGGGRGGGGRR